MDLSLTEYKYYRLFGQRTEAGIVEEMLNFDEKLKVNYTIYQKLLHGLRGATEAEGVPTVSSCLSFQSTVLERSFQKIFTYLFYMTNTI